MAYGGEPRPTGRNRFVAPVVVVGLNLLLFVGASTPPIQAIQGIVGNVARFTSEPFGAVGRASAAFVAGFGDVRELRSMLGAAGRHPPRAARSRSSHGRAWRMAASSCSGVGWVRKRICRLSISVLAIVCAGWPPSAA